jgi:ABC-2 type transport system ATP-binding protein
MIITHDLTKRFIISPSPISLRRRELKQIVALDHITLHIKKGEVFGLIGPNGAGKTTFIKTLSTLIIPDEGTAEIAGKNITTDEKEVRKLLGVVTSEVPRSLSWRLTGKQNLMFFANMYGLFGKDAENRIEYLLERFGLAEWKDQMVMKYSTGMKHKLALVRALLNDPPVLLLDEPTTGIDPFSQYDIRRYVRKELKDKTVIWASHNLLEVEQVCDRIALINKGKIVLMGRPDDLKEKYWDYEKISIELSLPEASRFSQLEGAKIENDHVVEISTTDLSETFAQIQKVLSKDNVHLKHIRTHNPSLEDIFRKVVQE